LVTEPTEVSRYWRDDLVAFVIGCSFTFENALLAAGVSVRHIEQGVNVPMYRTNIPCRPPAGSPGRWSCRCGPLRPSLCLKAAEVCGQFPRAHGAPIHFGDPSAIGIRDINKPDYGDAVAIRDGEVPVFWACGVTPQAALMQARPPFAITHSPGTCSSLISVMRS